MSEKKLPENVFLVVDRHLHPLDREVINIGRHPDNDLIIHEPQISRKHAQIRFSKGVFSIHDLGSMHGTFVNGERVKSAEIRSGDTVSLANTPLLFIDRSSTLVSRAQDVTGTLDN